MSRYHLKPPTGTGALYFESGSVRVDLRTGEVLAGPATVTGDAVNGWTVDVEDYMPRLVAVDGFP